MNTNPFLQRINIYLNVWVALDLGDQVFEILVSNCNIFPHNCDKSCNRSSYSILNIFNWKFAWLWITIIILKHHYGKIVHHKQVNQLNWNMKPRHLQYFVLSKLSHFVREIGQMYWRVFSFFFFFWTCWSKLKSFCRKMEQMYLSFSETHVYHFLYS